MNKYGRHGTPAPGARERVWFRYHIVLLLFFFFLGGSPALDGGADKSAGKATGKPTTMPPVSYRQVTLNSTAELHLIQVQLGASDVEIVATGPGARGKKMTTYAFAEELRKKSPPGSHVFAINANFFTPSADPIGAAFGDGHWWQRSLSHRGKHAIVCDNARQCRFVPSQQHIAGTNLSAVVAGLKSVLSGVLSLRVRTCSAADGGHAGKKPGVRSRCALSLAMGIQSHAVGPPRVA